MSISSLFTKGSKNIKHREKKVNSNLFNTNLYRPAHKIEGLDKANITFIEFKLLSYLQRFQGGPNARTKWGVGLFITVCLKGA